jgi:hypothetical protein
MYSGHTVVAIKVGGAVLREHGDTVALPFGSEYSILIRNLNSVRMQAQVWVDGQDATDGRVIIGSNSALSLERFIKHGHLDAGNRFKFIERTADVEAHRGIGADDGLIRVETWRECIRPQPLQLRYRCPIRPGAPLMAASTASLRPRQAMAFRSFDSRSEAGITVPGSKSDQRFHVSSGFELEPTSTVIVLRLRGHTGVAPVDAPVTVAWKPECETCGKVNDADNRFCSRCGAALEVFA